MKFSFQKIVIPFSIGLLLLPVIVSAGVVGFNADTTAVFTVGNCTIKDGSIANSVDISGNTLSIDLTTGDIFTINCPPTVQLTSTPSRGETCETDGTRTYRVTSGQSSLVTSFTAAAVTTSCTTVGGGGGGGPGPPTIQPPPPTTQPPPPEQITEGEEEVVAEGEEAAIEGEVEEEREAPITTVFSDVTGHWGVSFIERAYEQNIMSGYSDGSMRPNNSANRAEALKMILTGFDVSVEESVEESPFDDVPVTQWYAPYVAQAKAKGYVKGRKGNFEPGAFIKRAEVLALVLRVFGDEPADDYEPAGDKVFTDIDVGAWYYKYVYYAADKGIVSGYADGTFRPGAEVKRAELLAMLFRALDQ